MLCGMNNALRDIFESEDYATGIAVMIAYTIVGFITGIVIVGRKIVE